MENLKDIMLDYVQVAEAIKIRLVGESLSERVKIDTIAIVNGLINLRLAIALEESNKKEDTVETKEEKKSTAKK